MSRQSRRNEECNIYGDTFDDRALDIADRSLAGEILADTDTIGLSPEKFGLGDHVLPGAKGEAQTDGETGSHREARTHKGDIEGGSSVVRNSPARYEHQSQKDHPHVHAARTITESPEPQKR